MVLVELGTVAERRGDAGAALALHMEGLDAALAIDAPRDIASALEALAASLSLAGRHRDAARMLGAAATARTSAALPASPAEREDVDRVTGATRAALGWDAFAAEYATGGALGPAGARPLAAPAGSA